MSDVEPPPPEPTITKEDRIRALLEVLLISGIVSSLLASVTFVLFSGGGRSALQDARAIVAFILVEAGLTLLLLALLVRVHHESARELGILWDEWKPNAMIGLALVPILLLLSAILSETFRRLLQGYFLERNPLTELIRTPQDLGLFILSVLIAGGIKEELQRVFILRRFDRYLGGARLGLVIWSLVFGLAHYIQGLQGVVMATLFGFIFGAVYLKRGNVIGPIVGHALYDTVALLGYWLTRSSAH